MQLAVYACSTLSHWFRDPARLSLFRKLDQGFIYLLIVASFTPFTVAHQSGIWWFTSVIGLMWIMAIAGFVSKLVGFQVESVDIRMYLLLGWTPFISGQPFFGGVPGGAAIMIMLAGAFYSSGSWFLYKDKSVWYFHAIWHTFVIMGSVTLFFAVCWYV